ncbi:hypothetical protein DFQ01_104163 [Paenibacillus cellulosilyticus]|uniref:DUF2953 family protein n=1 Tax=Paenibacillus cellulosilyticus TaxID=375489 RepID=A0A2V2YWJ8_9BACL|nr:DUF2953 domain-containing protein [Paenibacillus cellulosilyticus]PWW05603.1 hypothetical protein DFQ01_104163 [Paenibacillus cellulosilyticus]QKS45365.1 DUF2953 domain-containing protein [Paenibacillus cellulosilyticus]
MAAFSHGWIWWAAAGLFFLIGMLIWFSPIVLTAQMKKINLNDDLEIHIKALFGIVRLKWRMPVLEWTNRGIKVRTEKNNMQGHGEQEEEMDAARVLSLTNRLKMIVTQIEDTASLVKKVLANVKIEEWRWVTEVGTGDAMWTAMCTGMLWSVKTTAVGVASQFMQLMASPVLDVQPAYNRTCIVSEWKIAARMRLGQAGIAGLRLVNAMRKMKAGTTGLQRVLPKI